MPLAAWILLGLATPYMYQGHYSVVLGPVIVMVGAYWLPAIL